MNIPIYNALLSDENDGMICISLVDEPAVESEFVAFNKQEKLTFSILNEEERMILGVVMRADFPIYRYSESMGEYYIKYSKETIKAMTQRFLADNNQNKINLMHQSGDYKDGVELVQIFIKNEEKGISPKGFENIEDGSLFAQYHIENNDIWEKVKDGTFQGFSLEMYCTIEEQKQETKHNNIKKHTSMTIEKIKNVLRSLLVECGNTMTDKGNLFYEGEDLIEGISVFSDEEMETVAEDGEYETDDKIATVENGSVKEIKDKEIPEEEPTETEEPKEEEVEAEEETVEETPTEEPKEEETVEDDKIAELLARIEALEAKVAELEAKMTEPIAEPIAEEFSKVKDTPSNKWERYAEMIRNSKM